MMASFAEISKAFASIEKKKLRNEALFKEYAGLGGMHPFQKQLMDQITNAFDELVSCSLLCLDKIREVIREIGKTNNNKQNSLQERRAAISKQIALMRLERSKFMTANKTLEDHHQLYQNYRKSQMFQETIFATMKKKVPTLMVQFNLELATIETMKLYQERGDKLTAAVKKDVEDINGLVAKIVQFVEKLWDHHKALMQRTPGRTASQEPQLSQMSSSLLSWCATASPARSSGHSASQPSSSGIGSTSSSPGVASGSSGLSQLSSLSPTGSQLGINLSRAVSASRNLFPQTPGVIPPTQEEGGVAVKEERPSYEDKDLFFDSLA